MNIEQTTMCMEVMQAFRDRREIVATNNSEARVDINESKNPTWNWFHFHYRIKPSKKIVPFTIDSCPVGKVIRSKAMGVRTLIIRCGLSTAKTALDTLSYGDLLMGFTMDDGSPCGIEITE